MELNRQSSKGDGSPNFSGSVDTGGGSFSLVTIAAKVSKANEVKQILAIIEDLSKKATSLNLEPGEEDYTKKLQQKLALFPEYANRLKHDYVSLASVYAAPYNDAWANSNIDEYGRKKIAIYLSSRSISLLEEHKENAILAISSLCKELEESVPQDFEFDSNGVKFFIYMQFIECNVFPLIGGQDE